MASSRSRLARVYFEMLFLQLSNLYANEYAITVETKKGSRGNAAVVNLDLAFRWKCPKNPNSRTTLLSRYLCKWVPINSVLFENKLQLIKIETRRSNDTSRYCMMMSHAHVENLEKKSEGFANW